MICVKRFTLIGLVIVVMAGSTANAWISPRQIFSSVLGTLGQHRYAATTATAFVLAAGAGLTYLWYKGYLSFRHVQQPTPVVPPAPAVPAQPEAQPLGGSFVVIARSAADEQPPVVDQQPNNQPTAARRIAQGAVQLVTGANNFVIQPVVNGVKTGAHAAANGVTVVAPYARSVATTVGHAAGNVYNRFVRTQAPTQPEQPVVPVVDLSASSVANSFVAVDAHSNPELNNQQPTVAQQVMNTVAPVATEVAQQLQDAAHGAANVARASVQAVENLVGGQQNVQPQPNPAPVGGDLQEAANILPVDGETTAQLQQPDITMSYHQPEAQQQSLTQEQLRAAQATDEVADNMQDPAASAASEDDAQYQDPLTESTMSQQQPGAAQ